MNRWHPLWLWLVFLFPCFSCKQEPASNDDSSMSQTQEETSKKDSPTNNYSEESSTPSSFPDDSGAITSPKCNNTAAAEGKKAVYKITFNSTWSETTHPQDFPSANPHYSKLVALSHNSSYTLWEEGKQVSPGVKLIAETGGTSEILNEFESEQDQASICYYKVAPKPIATTPDLASLTVVVHEDFPYLSAITMIAPSPDWFVGISAINLLDGSSWVQSRTIKAFAYDAGTDDGESYTSANKASNPQIAAFKITNGPVAESIGELGEFYIEKQ